MVFQHSYERFVEMAPLNPAETLQMARHDLARAMEIGSYLVDNDMLSQKKGWPFIQKFLKHNHWYHIIDVMSKTNDN